MIQQLESTLLMSMEILADARRRLGKRSREDEEVLSLRGESPGRILCPWCRYSSKKNKSSAILRADNTIKCFSCGKFGRIE